MLKGILILMLALLASGCGCGCYRSYGVGYTYSAGYNAGVQYEDTDYAPASTRYRTHVVRYRNPTSGACTNLNPNACVGRRRLNEPIWVTRTHRRWP